jgi:hypothetical protein
MGDAADLAATAHGFNKILSQPKLSSKKRTPEDVEESEKKLRRLILIEGIPSKAKAVRTPFGLASVISRRIALCDHIFLGWFLFAGSYAAMQDLENPPQGQ